MTLEHSVVKKLPADKGTDANKTIPATIEGRANLPPLSRFMKPSIIFSLQRSVTRVLTTGDFPIANVLGPTERRARIKLR